MRRSLRRSIVGAVLTAILAPLSALAQIIDWTEAEIAGTPRYCQVHHFMRGAGTTTKYPAENEVWKNRIGMPEHNALHHYCWAQIWLWRARFSAKDAQYRKFYFENAVRDIDYVLRHVVRKEFVLLPELLHKKGETLVELGRAGEAAKEFLRAIEVKPDYWPPYASLSDLHRKLGDLPKAKDWIEKGLAVDPAAKPLLRRQAELSGAGGTKGKGRPPSSGPVEAPGAPEARNP